MPANGRGNGKREPAFAGDKVTFTILLSVGYRRMSVLQKTTNTTCTFTSFTSGSRDSLLSTSALSTLPIPLRKLCESLIHRYIVLPPAALVRSRLDVLRRRRTWRQRFAKLWASREEHHAEED